MLVVDEVVVVMVEMVEDEQESEGDNFDLVLTWNQNKEV